MHGFPEAGAALPPGWGMSWNVLDLYRLEMKVDANGRPYFVDHVHKVTQWTDPRTGVVPMTNMPT